MLFSLPIWVLLAISVITGVIYSTTSADYSKKYVTNYISIQQFVFVNTTMTFFSLFALSFAAGSSFHFSAFSVILGVAMAFVNTFCAEANCKAMSCGPVSYTTLIAALSAVIPTFSGLILFNESISAYQYFGIFLMVVCVILSPEKAKDDEEKSIGVKWLIFTGIVFVLTGAVGVIQKYHQNSPVHKNEIAALLLTSFFISMVFSGVKLWFMTKKATRATGTKPPFMPKKALIYPIVGGLLYAFPHTINLYLSGVLPAVVFFPVINLTPTILVMIYSFIAYKEKPGLMRIIGIVIGFASMFFLSGILQ